MEIEQVPFAAHNGIEIDADNTVYLPAQSHVHNHMNGVHAGAQFLLAESASGYYLLTAFPDFVGRVIPLLRQSTIKYSQQAAGSLRSKINIAESVQDKFLETLSTKGRALIDVEVEIVNEADEVTCSASFRWFVQLNDIK